MATKFLKSPNGGIYKDSNGNLVAVEPERVIRDIDGSIPASTLEDISVSTGTASTNGVTYIRATMKGEVTYTDNTHDTINYYIDLPIKAGEGVTIEAQPVTEGSQAGNKQLVISASGGGGTTLQRFTATITLSTPLVNEAIKNAWKLLSAILRIAKGKVTITGSSNAGGAGCFSIEQPNDDVKVRLFQGLYGTSWQTSNETVMLETNRFGSEVKLAKFNDNWSDGTFKRTYSSPSSTGVKIQYWNDTEITI